MYRDGTQWLSIRNQILRKGVSIRQIVRETGISRDTVRKMLDHPLPQLYGPRSHRYPKLGPHTTEMPQARRGSKIDWTSAAKDALLWVPAGGHGHPVKQLGLASRCAGLWVVRASIPAPRTNGAQTMSTLSHLSRTDCVVSGMVQRHIR